MSAVLQKPLILLLFVRCSMNEPTSASSKGTTKPPEPQWCDMQMSYKSSLRDEGPALGFPLGSTLLGSIYPLLTGNNKPAPDDVFLSQIISSPKEYAAHIEKRYPNVALFGSILGYLAYGLLIIGILVIIGRCCGSCGAQRVQAYDETYNPRYSLYTRIVLISMIVFIVVVIVAHMTTGAVKDVYGRAEEYYTNAFSDLEAFFSNFYFLKLCALTQINRSKPEEGDRRSLLNLDDIGQWAFVKSQPEMEEQVDSNSSNNMEKFLLQENLKDMQKSISQFKNNTSDFEEKSQMYSSVGRPKNFMSIGMYFGYLGALLFIIGLIMGWTSHDENIDPRSRTSDMPSTLLMYGAFFAWLFCVFMLFATSSAINHSFIGEYYICPGYLKGKYASFDVLLAGFSKPEARPPLTRQITISAIYTHCKEGEGAPIENVKGEQPKNDSNSTEGVPSVKPFVSRFDFGKEIDLLKELLDVANGLSGLSLQARNYIMMAEAKWRVPDESSDQGQQNGASGENGTLNEKPPPPSGLCNPLYVVVESGARGYCLGFIENLGDLIMLALPTALVFIVLTVSSILLSQYYRRMDEIILPKEPPKKKEKPRPLPRKQPLPVAAKKPITAVANADLNKQSQTDVKSLPCTRQPSDDATHIRIITDRNSQSSYSEHEELHIRIPQQMVEEPPVKPKQNVHEIVDIKIPYLLPPPPPPPPPQAVSRTQIIEIEVPTRLRGLIGPPAGIMRFNLDDPEIPYGYPVAPTFPEFCQPVLPKYISTGGCGCSVHDAEDDGIHHHVIVSDTAESVSVSYMQPSSSKTRNVPQAPVTQPYSPSAPAKKPRKGLLKNKTPGPIRPSARRGRGRGRRRR